jgi:hypothetical protein
VLSADLALDLATTPSGAAKIIAKDGLSLACTIVEAGVFLSAAYVRLVGGAGGLAKYVPAAFYKQPQISDLLNAVIQASGETLSGTIESTLTSIKVPFWSQARARGAAVLDTIAAAAAAHLNAAVNWRLLSDGTLWMGAETWPDEALPKGAAVLDVLPAERRYEIGAEVPTLVPGVNLDGVGNVVGVDHWLTPGAVRTWALT